MFDNINIFHNITVKSLKDSLYGTSKKDLPITIIALCVNRTTNNFLIEIVSIDTDTQLEHVIRSKIKELNSDNCLLLSLSQVTFYSNGLDLTPSQETLFIRTAGVQSFRQISIIKIIRKDNIIEKLENVQYTNGYKLKCSAWVDRFFIPLTSLN